MLAWVGAEGGDERLEKTWLLGVERGPPDGKAGNEKAG